ncbi:MAG: GreA/GreB family elongation factor [Gammaproteobacteria bacterium]|nr:GreA/GreB family elongation factor [Gammaproteobacteria bacterium]
MDKELLHQTILAELNALRQDAINAAMQAYNTATHAENVADNKYDTLGLEASYLAQGQAKRVANCEANLAIFARLKITHFTSQTAISLGALIYLMDDKGSEQVLFLAPVSGGVKINFSGLNITLITPSAPLGKKLMGCYVDDKIEIELTGQKNHYDITAIY